jgi:hypothetical protein
MTGFFQVADLLQPIPENIVIKQLRDLEADFGELIGIERGNAALGGAEALARQTGLLVFVHQRMIGHDHLGTLGDDELGGRHAPGEQLGHLGVHFADVQCHAVAHNVGDVGVEHAGGHGVQGKFAVVVDDGVTGICAALEADDNVGILRQHVGDLSLSLVAPVGAYNRFDHNISLSAAAECRTFSQYILFYLIRGGFARSKLGLYFHSLML